MSFKPLIIDTGVLKQLPAGQALDAGGWTLPTAGGTENFVLTANVSGDAVWAAVLPNPTADDQILISTGVGTATWSTAGNNQVIASDGSGNVAWENKPFGYNIPANSAANEVYVGTGVGTAAWTTDLIGLTSLTVDNITINAFSITSDTGTVSFGDDNMFTLGTVIGNNIPSPSVDNQVLISLAADTAAWSVATKDQVLGSDGGANVAWENKPFGYDIPANSAENEVYVGTGAGTAAWTTDLIGLTSLTVDNITINGAMITSSTGVISFSNENLTTTGTVVGANIPSPTEDDQALSSTAAGVASWNVTCLADVLAQEVPSASGIEKKFVLTADSESKFEIEVAPWPLILTANETVYVRTTGNDTTGDGSSGLPFLTLEKTIEYLGGLYIGEYSITVDIGEGIFTEASSLRFNNPFGRQVTWEGVSEQITSQDTDSISASGTTLGHSNLYRYDVTMVLPVGKSVSVGDYIAIRSVSGGTLPRALQGCHYVSGWDGGSRTATIQIVYRDGAPKASGTVTCTIELIKTIIAFDNKNGIVVDGPYDAGVWKALVLEGNYSSTNTNAKYGIRTRNAGNITIGGNVTSGWATASVGFETGLLSQDNSRLTAVYSFVSKCGLYCVSAQDASIVIVLGSRLSGANNSGIFANKGSTVLASITQVVAVGDDSVLAYQGSFVDFVSGYVDHNNATNALSADRWSSVDGTGATYSDAINPATGGNNDGSYIIT